MELTECKKTTEVVTRISNNQSLFTIINQRLGSADDQVRLPHTCD